MDSIKKIYKIGNGPSSSHTMGPKFAATKFLTNNPDASIFKVHIYGSLALTGKGHMTDIAILDTLGDNAEIVWHPNEKLPLHPNGMLFEAFDKDSEIIDSWEVYSVGGGELMDEDNKIEPKIFYPHTNMASILKHLKKEGGTLWEYVLRNEEDDLIDYLWEVWTAMKEAIERGLNT